MKRGIPRTVGPIIRPLTYNYTRSLLIEKLKLPADAVLTVDGETLDDELLTLLVHCKETVKTRAPKAATLPLAGVA